MDEDLNEIIKDIDLDKPWMENVDPKSAAKIQEKTAHLDEDEKAVVQDWLWQALIKTTILELLFNGSIKIDGIKPVMEQKAPILELMEEMEGEFYCKDIEPNFVKA